jgi:glycine/D-amino acid oxidase-like deaminating enzyme
MAKIAIIGGGVIGSSIGPYYLALASAAADVIVIDDPLKPQHAASTMGPGSRSASYSLCSG